MKPAPEYALARALIAHLRQQVELADAVLPDPWDREDQNQNLAMAAAQFGLAVAACPQPPTLVGEGAAEAGFLQARVAVVILTTAQVQDGAAAELQAAAAGRALAACLDWDFQARGVPYAAPRLLEAAQLDTASLAGFDNLLGSSLTLGWRVNYKSYYSSS